jgi:hypothetical protein
MYELNQNYHQQTLVAGAINAASPYSYVMTAANALFRRALWRANLTKIKSLFTRRVNWLIALSDLEGQLNRLGICYAGRRPVDIRQIVGTEGRMHDFDRQFNPTSERLRQRWLSVAIARYQSLALPPIDLIQVGDGYFVRDGHHRISVARALGEEAIDAEIIQWAVEDPDRLAPKGR